MRVHRRLATGIAFTVLFAACSGLAATIIFEVGSVYECLFRSSLLSRRHKAKFVGRRPHKAGESNQMDIGSISTKTVQCIHRPGRFVRKAVI